HEQKLQLIEALSQQSWTIDKDVNRQLVSHCVMSLEKTVYEQMPQGNIAAHQAVIAEAVSQPTLSQVMSNIAGWGDEDSWLKRAKRSMVNGSPLSARILERQLEVGKSLTLAQCFKLELQLSVLSGELGEFAEGIRALLIDKDNQPAWKYSDVDSVDDAVIDNLFNPIWDENAHPLKLKGE
ncbi:MAG: enoyl-CoA hydratase/isomerase family protein, partial [Psychrobium sp.]